MGTVLQMELLALADSGNGVSDAAHEGLIVCRLHSCEGGLEQLWRTPCPRPSNTICVTWQQATCLKQATRATAAANTVSDIRHTACYQKVNYFTSCLETATGLQAASQTESAKLCQVYVSHQPRSCHLVVLPLLFRTAPLPAGSQQCICIQPSADVTNTT
jgi:hypothetical protein